MPWGNSGVSRPVPDSGAPLKRIQEELRNRLGVSIPDVNDSPLKVFTQTDQYGAGANSLHNRMNAWNGGSLTPARITDPVAYPSAQSLIDELLRFYKPEPTKPDWIGMVKAARGWATQDGIPFTQ